MQTKKSLLQGSILSTFIKRLFTLMMPSNENHHSSSSNQFIVFCSNVILLSSKKATEGLFLFFFFFLQKAALIFFSKPPSSPLSPDPTALERSRLLCLAGGSDTLSPGSCPVLKSEQAESNGQDCLQYIVVVQRHGRAFDLPLSLGMGQYIVSHFLFSGKHSTEMKNSKMAFNSVNAAVQ